jgi:hypothetical protein
MLMSAVVVLVGLTEIVGLGALMVVEQVTTQLAVLEQFASFGPAPLAHSHQQIRGTCNA